VETPPGDGAWRTEEAARAALGNSAARRTAARIGQEALASVWVATAQPSTFILFYFYFYQGRPKGWSVLGQRHRSRPAGREAVKPIPLPLCEEKVNVKNDRDAFPLMYSMHIYTMTVVVVRDSK